MKYYVRRMALIVAIVMLSATLSGCSGQPATPAATQVPNPTATVIPTAEPSSATDNGVAASTLVSATNPLSVEGLDATQLNSINMLNHLVVLSQEINASKNSRLYLEEAYSLLINNTSPDAIDGRTLVEINYLLDTLEQYRMIAAKRDRLQYIYEQNQAQALRDAIPNPLAMMNTIHSFSLGKLVTSVVYMAVDSYTSYESSSAQANLQYLQDGWALDDEQATALHEIRKDTFNYMVETVQGYKIPGRLALTEQAVADYVEWKNKSNTLQVIQFFEQNIDTYRAFGPYWLTLAECYYKIGDYEKCLAAITTYEQLDNRIFRRDYQYAQVLPLAIVSARQVYDDTRYIQVAPRYAAAIMNNTDNDAWSLRYFAAQTNIELYALTNDRSYLETAYTIALNNVNYLIDEQKELNTTYLADVQEVVAEKGTPKAQQEEINSYNKMLKAERVKELPPVNEPLLLNCELLFSLADELGIDATEMARVDGILHENGAPLFLVEPLDTLYRMNGTEYTPDATQIVFSDNKILVPARFVSEEASISLTIEREGIEPIVITDWTVEKVERKDKADLTTFIATYSSPTAKEHKYMVGDVLTIRVVPKASLQTCVFTCSYSAAAGKVLWVFDSVEFQRNAE